MEPQLHVYLDRKPDGTPFYVGIGTAARVGKKSRSVWHTNICKKYPGWTRTVIETAPRELCEELEKLVISELGRREVGGLLVNQTDGGEGVEGLRHKDETKAELSKLAKIQFQDPEQRRLQQKMKQALWADPEYRATNSAGNAERVRRPETRRKISESGKGRKHPPEEIQHRAESLRRIHAENEELKSRMVEVGHEISQRPEVAAKMREAAIRYKRSDAGRWQTSEQFSKLIWITDGVRNRRVLPEELEKYVGFCKGRTYVRKVNTP